MNDEEGGLDHCRFFRGYGTVVLIRIGLLLPGGIPCTNGSFDRSDLSVHDGSCCDHWRNLWVVSKKETLKGSSS